MTWSYDNSYQLTREKRDGDNAYDVTFTYDAVGNRATKLSGGTTTTYTYDAANKMTVTNDGTTLSTFTYDSNGNQTVKNVGGSLTTYTYSCENKMTGITYPDASLNTFTYDGDGKRLQKQDSVGTLRLVYDHQGPTGLYDLAKETDGSNNLVAFYTQGPMLISQRRGGNSYFYHDDALGSIANTTNSSETVTSTYKYYAFGEVLTSTGTLTNPFKYVGGLGYYSDPDSGLLLLRARYYWPQVGRFVTRDPVKEMVNWYGYVRGRPTRLVDPSGLLWSGWCWVYCAPLVPGSPAYWLCVFTCEAGIELPEVCKKFLPEKPKREKEYSPDTIEDCTSLSKVWGKSTFLERCLSCCHHLEAAHPEIPFPECHDACVDEYNR